MALARPLTSFEKFFYGAECMVQLSFDISEPSYVTDLIDQLSRSVVGLHLKTDGKTLFSTNAPIEVIPIPHHLKTIQEATDYIAYDCAPKLSERLAVIGADRHRVILSVSHMCADGGYLQSLVDTLRGGRLPQVPTHLTPVEEFFDREMKRHGASVKVLHVDPTLSRLYRKTVQTHILKNPRAGCREIRMPATELACYNPETKRLHGLTETLWLSTVMSSFCHNGKAGPIGCSTCINMRQFIPKEHVDLSFGNCYSAVTVNAEYDKTATVEDVAKRLRADFRDKMKRGMQYEYMNAMMRDYNLQGIEGAGCEVSNIGPLVIQDPIRDVRCSVSGSGGDAPYYSLLSFSVQKQKMNDVIVQIQYNPTYVTPKEVDGIERSVRFSLRDLSGKAKFLDAYREMQRIHGLA